MIIWFLHQFKPVQLKLSATRSKILKSQKFKNQRNSVDYFMFNTFLCILFWMLNNKLNMQNYIEMIEQSDL